MKKVKSSFAAKDIRVITGSDLASVVGGNNDPVPGIDIITDRCPGCKVEEPNCECTSSATGTVAPQFSGMLFKR